MQRMKSDKEKLEAETIHGPFDIFLLCMICKFRNDRIRDADSFNTLPKSQFHLGSCTLPMF